MTVCAFSKIKLLACLQAWNKCFNFKNPDGRRLWKTKNPHEKLSNFQKISLANSEKSRLDLVYLFQACCLQPKNILDCFSKILDASWSSKIDADGCDWSWSSVEMTFWWKDFHMRCMVFRNAKCNARQKKKILHLHFYNTICILHDMKKIMYKKKLRDNSNGNIKFNCYTWWIITNAWMRMPINQVKDYLNQQANYIIKSYWCKMSYV